jgi:TRAP-type C4-dicarboxylate transport system substrate-binding protein
MISRPRVAVLALGVLSALALAGCAEEGSGGSGGGSEGVEPGATMEEYQAAFADIDPIKLNTQSPGPKGGATGAPIERWVEAVEEWSDGKITFEIAYSNAAAEPTEIDDALNDGRLDVASTLPIYEPSEYPANAALIETGFLSDQSVVAGALSSNAWPNEVAFNDEAVMAEYEDHGLVPLVPIFNSGSQIVLCSQTRTGLDDFKGASISASGTAQSGQIESLGATPVSIAYTELFESIQRGVVDCANTTFTVAQLGGFLPVAPNITVSPEAGFSMAPGGWSFSAATWEELPLVAKQLMWDRLDVYIAGNIAGKIWPDTATGAAAVRENNGSVKEFDAAAIEALQEFNEGLLANLRETDLHPDGNGLVDAALESSETWSEKVSQLDIPEGVTHEDFDEKFDIEAFDMDAYTELIMSDIWSTHRPS